MDAYQQWSPATYLWQYYLASHLPGDDRAIFDLLKRRPRAADRTFRRAVEFGCGPVVYRAAPLVQFVEELHMADFLSENLDEIRKWRDDLPGAFNWDALITAVLTREGAPAEKADLERRKMSLRRKMTGIVGGGGGAG